MGEKRPQSLENHTRLDPVFHFFLLPMAAITFGAAAFNATRHPDLFSIWLAFAAFLFVLAVFLIRTYGLKVQDRVIRLEERLRLAMLLPDSSRGRLGDLTEGQLVALRFACDTEVLALASKAVDEKLSPGDIKKSIVVWRPDYFRL